MKTYLITLTSAVVLASVTDIMLPNNSKKYVSLITGAMILICLISPLTKISNTSLPSLTIPRQEYIDYSLDDILVTEFKNNVEKDISDRLFSEFGISAKVNVGVKISNGNISGVDRITIFSEQNSDIQERLSFIYGCNLIEFSDGGENEYSISY